MTKRISQLDWDQISGQLNDNGYACVKKRIFDAECDALVEAYDNEKLYRKAINMERYRFGLGEYKYFSYPLPDIIAQLRQDIYPYLAPVANNWMKVLSIHYAILCCMNQFLSQVTCVSIRTSVQCNQHAYRFCFAITEQEVGICVQCSCISRAVDPSCAVCERKWLMQHVRMQ